MTTDLEHRLGLGDSNGVKRALRAWTDRDGKTTPLGSAAADLIERQERTIADLTEALDQILALQLYANDSIGREIKRIASAALTRAKGGPLTSVSTADLDARDMRLNRGATSK